MNIKDAYIHNGLGVLRELQVTAAGMLQLKRAAKDSNDAYVGWEDVYNLTNIKPTNAGTADNVPWTGITGKPDTFPVATHDHDDRYLKLAGNTTSAPVTGPIYIDGPGLFIRSKDATKNIWEIVGDGTAWTSNYGFYLQYYGAGSGNNNDLILFSHGQASTDVEVYRVHQDGSFVFKSVPKVGTNNIYHAGNLTIGTLMGSTAVGDSDEPVYWNGTAFVKANAYPTKASWNYDDVYLKLSGGNLTGKLTIKTNNFGNQLTLDRGADGGSWGPSITFYNNGTFLASLGVDTSGTLYKGDNGNTKYAIYHAGNLTPKTITLSTSAQTYITAGSTNYTLQMPSTDPYTSARTPSAHDHERIKPTRHDSDDPAPNTKGAYLTFQFSYIGGHWWNVLNMRSYTDMKYVSAELLTPANNPGADTGYSGNMMWRQGRNSTWLDMRTILDSANYTDYTVKKDGTGATGTWGIDISGNAATATTATNSDKVDELHAMSAGSLLYKYAVTATIPASSVTGDFWYATITFARSYVRELTRSMLDATYSNYQGQVYLNTYEYNGAWYAFTTNYNGSNIKGIAHKSQNNPIYYVKLAKPVTYNNTVPDGTITVYSPYNCTITVSATAPSGVTFTSLTTPGFTNLKASSAYSADSATTATYASNVGAAGTAGTNYVAASKVIAACNWYDTMIGTDSNTVIDRWSEIVAFVANFEETPDLATYLSNNYLAKSGGTMTGQLKWKDSNALPEQTSPQYFLCIESFTNGGATKWASKANTLKALTGLTSTALGDSNEPVYWDGSKFVKAGAYPTKASWNYDDVYLKLSGGTLTGNVTYNNEKSSVYKQIRKKSGGGGWAYAPIYFTGNDDSTYFRIGMYGGDDTFNYAYLGTDSSYSGAHNLRIYSDEVKFGDNLIWHAGNDGSGSGLDADTVDGIHGTDFVEKRYGRFYPFIASDPTRSIWHKVTFPHTGYTSSTTAWFMLTMEIVLSGSYQNAAAGKIFLNYYFLKDSSNVWSVATVKGIAIGTHITSSGVQIRYDIANPAIFYIKVSPGSYTSFAIENLSANDTAQNFDYRTTTIEAVAAGDIPTAADKYVPIAIIDSDDGTSIKIPALTDVLTLKAGAYAADNTWTYPGGSYRSVQKPNLRLIGDSTYGLSTIEFISQKGDTSINKPSDCAFIQFQPYGTGTLAAVGSAPTLNTSGEINRLVIGVSNDSNDILVLQTPATTGLKHVVATNSYTIWDAGNDGSGSGLDADLLDGFHAADFRNNIVDLRSSPQTFNPTYLKDIVFISEADYTTLVSNGSITKNSITHTYNASNWYVIEDKVPEYAENAGNADYASNAGYAGTANWANNVEWDDVKNKPSWANSSLAWSDVTGKPTWVTWSETSSTATYSLSNATWTQTITLPTTAGSYILKLVSGNSTLTGVFSIGASDNAKDEISLHLHGNGPRLYARTNGTKLELSRNIATATNTSVTITYRRMI